MSFSIYQIVILLGTINGGILLLSLSSLPLRFRNPARYLGLFILGYTLYICNWMIFPEIGYNFNVIVLWVPTLFFLPALTYYFAKSITSKPSDLSGPSWHLFIPGILDTIFQIGRWIFDLTKEEGYYFRMDYKTEFFIYEGLALVFSYVCIVSIIRMTRRFTYKKGPTYVFYKHAFYFLIFILLRWTVLYMFDMFRPDLLTFQLYFSFWTLDICFFLFLGFKSLITPSMYSTKLLPSKELSGATDSEESRMLLDVLRGDQLFLNPDLARRDLSEKLNVSEIKVSSILNDELNTTFYGLVNQMRVEEAKRLIHNGLTDQYTLEGIAKESGFKSKTTFYKFFKKHTGVTPTEYVKSA